jgi:hypothetical protein
MEEQQNKRSDKTQKSSETTRGVGGSRNGEAWKGTIKQEKRQNRRRSSEIGGVTKQEEKQRNRKNDKAQRRIMKQEEEHQNMKRNNKIIRGVMK